MRLGWFVLASAVASAFACAQIAGLDDPGDFVAPPDAASAVGPSPDANGVVGVEGGVTIDASPDVQTDAGACANAIFCEDFDTDASVAQWARQDGGTGVLSLVGDPVRSPPRALRAANTGTGNAQLARIVPITNAMTCEMSVRVAAWTGEAYFFELGLDPSDKGGFSYWWIDIGKQAGQALLLEYSYDGNNTTNSTAYWDAPPANTWVRVTVELRLRGGPPSVRVLFDGKETTLRNIVVPASTTYRLAIGVGTDKNGTADEVVIDDVVCRAL